MFIDKCIRGMKIGANGEETLLYVDDVVVMANSKTDIPDVEKRWWRTMNENGMQINTQKGKTGILLKSRNIRHTYDVLTVPDKVPRVAEYTYLGVNFRETNLQEVEINKRIAKHHNNIRLI